MGELRYSSLMDEMKKIFTKYEPFWEKIRGFQIVFFEISIDSFQQFLHGLLLGEKGEKNMEDIAGNVLDRRHQSSLNRFLTKLKWDITKLNAIHFREDLHDWKGGVLALDNMLIEKFGKMMDGVGYLMDHCSGKNVLCQNVVSMYYHHGWQSLLLFGQQYLKKDFAERVDHG